MYSHPQVVVIHQLKRKLNSSFHKSTPHKTPSMTSVWFVQFIPSFCADWHQFVSITFSFHSQVDGFSLASEIIPYQNVSVS